MGGNRVFHVKLCALAANKVRLAALLCHLISQGNTLCLGHNNIIKLGTFFEKLRCRSNGNFNIAENYKGCNIKFIVNFAKGKLPFKTGNFHFVS